MQSHAREPKNQWMIKLKKNWRAVKQNGYMQTTSNSVCMHNALYLVHSPIFYPPIDLGKPICQYYIFLSLQYFPMYHT